MDDAIRATLEMESYSKPPSSAMNQVSEGVDKDSSVAAATTQRPSDLKLVLERMERLETQLKELQQPPGSRSSGCPERTFSSRTASAPAGGLYHWSGVAGNGTEAATRT